MCAHLLIISKLIIYPKNYRNYERVMKNMKNYEKLWTVTIFSWCRLKLLKFVTMSAQVSQAACKCAWIHPPISYHKRLPMQLSSAMIRSRLSRRQPVGKRVQDSRTTAKNGSGSAVRAKYLTKPMSLYVATDLFCLNGHMLVCSTLHKPKQSGVGLQPQAKLQSSPSSLYFQRNGSAYIISLSTSCLSKL